MAEFPALPLYTDALLADCGHLSDTELGLYLRLLIQMWRSPSADGCLPDDDAWLARRFHRSIEAIQSELRPIIAEFCQVRGKKITQRRLQRELEHAREYRRKQAERAKTMWDKKKGRSHGNASAYAGNGIDPAYAAPAMHPIPNKESTYLLGKSPVPAKEESGLAGKQRASEAEALAVSPALAAKYTAPKLPPSEFADDLEIPEVLRRIA
jgi:uncharacterized protein YdaU (DUF1376 family)